MATIQDILKQKGATIKVGDTSWSTDYLNSAAGQRDLASVLRQADKQGYTTFQSTGTGDNTRMGTTNYNTDGTTTVHTNPYTWGEEAEAYRKLNAGDPSAYNALISNANTAYGSPTILNNSNGIATGPTNNGTSSPVSAQNSGMSEYIEKMKAAQIAQQTSRLDKIRNQALSNNSAEQTQVSPRYYEQKRQAIGQNQASARSFADYLAQRGLQSSGLAAQGEISRNVSLNNSIGNLNAQEAQTLDNLARQRTDIQNNYLSDLESAQQGIEANALQQLIEEARRQEDLSRQQQQYEQSLALQREQMNYDRNLQSENTAYNRLQDEKQLYQNNIGAYYNDYQAEINRVQNDGNPSNDWQIAMLKNARNQKLQEIAQLEAAQKAAALKAQQEAEKQALDNYYKQQELLLRQQQTKYNTSKPYYKPSTTTNKNNSVSLDW